MHPGGWCVTIKIDHSQVLRSSCTVCSVCTGTCSVRCHRPAAAAATAAAAPAAATAAAAAAAAVAAAAAAAAAAAPSPLP
jgi:hypothetical protein